MIKRGTKGDIACDSNMQISPTFNHTRGSGFFGGLQAISDRPVHSFAYRPKGRTPYEGSAMMRPWVREP